METTLKVVRPCPNCGKPLLAAALAGLCPACLLAQGQDTGTATPSGSGRFEAPALETVAKLFPQLEILGVLGAGGMGAVYKARQPALDRLVALKLLPRASTSANTGGVPGASGGNFAERFNREARALARLNHPNIVAVYEFGQVEGQHFFIMEFVDGANLRQLERAARLSPREALQIIPQICDALQYAHDEGVVHRDIKPENVLVDRKGRVKIADFGLAKILGQDAGSLRLTREGQVMGTPHYMAPEQVEKPLTVDHRADIYSLGVVFYEMLTGDLPLGKFAPPSRKVEVDVRLDEIVLRALENDPERRFQHASEVKSRVETIAETPVEGGTANPAKDRRASNESKGLFHGFAGFAVVRERAGQRQISWDGTMAVFGIVLGLTTLAFAFVTVFTGESLWGWVGIKGWPGFVVRILMAALVAAFGVRQAWQSRRTPETLPPGKVLLPSGRGGWRIGRGLIWAAVWVLAWSAFQVHILTPWLKKRYGEQLAGYDAFTSALAARLPGGARIELLAVGNSASADGAWWTPDGTALANGYEVRDRTGLKAIPGENHNFLIFRATGLPAASDGPLFGLPQNSPFDVSREVYQHGQRVVDARAVHVVWPTPRTRADVRVGLGVTEWQTAFSHDPKSGNTRRVENVGDSGMTFRVHQVGEENDDLLVTFVASENNVSDWQRKFIAVDDEGRERVATWANMTSGGTTTTDTYTFKNLSRAEVREFRLQVQELKWVKFQDVALQSGTGAAPPPERTFGPVQEVTFSELIDFDTGKTARFPNQPAHGNPLAGLGDALNWMQQNGFDATAGIGQIETLGVKLVELSRDDWEKLTPAELTRAVRDRGSFLGDLVPDAGNLPATYGFQTREGGMGLLQLVRFADPNIGATIRFKLVTAAGVTSEKVPARDTGWKPVVPNGEKLDPEKIRAEANELTRRGEYAEALKRHVWYHENAEKLVPSLSAVRRSFGLADWIELGRRYPEARQALQRTRDEKARAVLGGRGHFDLFMDLVSINGYLQEDDATVAAYKTLERADPALARQCFVAAKTPLVQAHEYELCLKYIPDPEAEVEKLRQLWKPGNSTASNRDGSAVQAASNTRFITEVRQLIEILLGVGRADEATNVQERAFEIFPDPALESALKDARERVAPASAKGRDSATARGDALPSTVEQPQLRFIAWQDEWTTNGARALRLPDGSPATNAVDLQLVRDMEPTRMILATAGPNEPESRFLHLWFSHPQFDRNSMIDVKFLSANGDELPPGARGSCNSGTRHEGQGSNQSVWLLATVSPGEAGRIPSSATVRLRYAIGPLENSRQVDPGFRGGMSLAGNSLLNGIGQNSEGNAFVTIAVDPKANANRRFAARVRTRDGREVESSGGGWNGSADGTGVRTDSFEFPVPLSAIEKFIIGTRPVRTMELANVVLGTEDSSHRARARSAIPTGENAAVADGAPPRLGLPRLRYIAWQDEWKTNGALALRFPDGTSATNESHLKLGRQMEPGLIYVATEAGKRDPKFLQLWYSHPEFDRESLVSLDLLDPSGTVIKLAADGSISSSFTERAELGQKESWIISKLSPGEGTNIPRLVTVRLRYAVGGMERTQTVAADFTGSATLEAGHVSGIGQGASGKTFLSLAAGSPSSHDRQSVVVPVKKDGSELRNGGRTTTGGAGAGFRSEKFEFNVPLAEIREFKIGTRPIRTVEWPHVVLGTETNR